MLPNDLKHYRRAVHINNDKFAENICFILTAFVTTALFVGLIFVFSFVAMTIQEPEPLTVQGVQK